MALHIKNPDIERLVSEVAQLTGESKTRAIRVALEERKQRLGLRGKARSRKDEMLRFLEREVWPKVPDDERGKRLTREEENAILGCGPAVAS
jgi:antitoxin VapB